ncbi:MAG: hypothetical protein V4617_03070 [Gemmatimonadota bacterium]
MRAERARGRAMIVRSSATLGMLGVLSVLGACADTEGANPSPSPSADLLVAVRHGAITAPDSVSPGWTRVRVEEAEDAHIVVLFRLPANSTEQDVAAFVAALDTAPATPQPGVAVGGPEVGVLGEVILRVTPGLHVLACVRRGEDGHRHASRGEFRVLHARPETAAHEATAAPPSGAQVVRMVDFAYVGTDGWTPGAQLLQVENTGKQDHEVRLVRLRDGATLQSWMTADDPDTVATSVAGMARIGPGEVAYLPVDLVPGSYLVYCLVADVRSRRPHLELGMVREIRVQ